MKIKLSSESLCMRLEYVVLWCRRWRPFDARAICLLQPWWSTAVGLTLSSQHVDKLSRNFSLWRRRPLALLLSTLPVTTKCSRLCFLVTWPKKRSCRWRIVFKGQRLGYRLMIAVSRGLCDCTSFLFSAFFRAVNQVGFFHIVPRCIVSYPIQFALV